MAQDLINNDMYVNGAFGAKVLIPPPGCITDTAVQAQAGIDATKLIHQFPLRYSQAPGTAVIAETTHLHITRATGTVVSIEAMTPTPATGADRTVSIDLQKSTAGGAFASILSAPITLNNSTTARAVVTVTIANTALVDGYFLELVVTVAGAVGNQAQGLLVTVTLRESPQ